MKHLVAIALLCASSAFAQNVVVGAGTQTCGTWTEARAGRLPNDTSSTFEMIAGSWVQGYLTGVNTESAMAGKGLNLPEVATMNAYLDKFCREKPLAQLWIASVALVIDIRKQQGK